MAVAKRTLPPNVAPAKRTKTNSVLADSWAGPPFGKETIDFKAFATKAIEERNISQHAGVKVATLFEGTFSIIPTISNACPSPRLEEVAAILPGQGGLSVAVASAKLPRHCFVKYVIEGKVACAVQGPIAKSKRRNRRFYYYGLHQD